MLRIFARSREGRLRLAGVVVVVATLAVAVPVLANLPGSSFESTDGNLLVNTPGNLDWENAPALEVGTDASQSKNDDSYTGGSKHDDVCPAAGLGSIPPNKDDLTQLYVSSESVGDDIFLYLGWERFLDRESSASAHMGFEFNQSTTPCGGGSNNVQRTAGDILVLYDLEGGGQPVLTLMTWLTVLLPGDSCAAANSAPCWGNSTNLSAAGFADGAINTTAPISDPINGKTLNFTNQFGEAAVNLTDAGVFEPGECFGFGRALLASRSSGNSFVSTLKDFVGPIPLEIQNCGDIVIKKETDPDGAAGSFAYSTTGGLDPATFNLSDGGEQQFNDLSAGTYSVTETDPAPAFDFVDLTCTQTGDSTITENGRTVTIDLEPLDVVTCTYTNRQRGSIIVEKQTDPADSSESFGFSAGAPLDPATFSLTDDGTRTNANLAAGTYTVSEDAKTGWDMTSIVCDDDSSTGDTGTRTATYELDPGETVRCVFSNRARGAISIHKEDDGGTVLAGVKFTAFVDAAPQGGTRGAEDDVAAGDCTTDASGNCTIGNLVPGRYWVVEDVTTLPAGLSPVADQNVTVGAGQTIPLSLVDPRTHRVIVLVCHEFSDDLLATNVVNGSGSKTSIGGVPAALAAKGVTEAELCDLGGASFGGLGHGDKTTTAQIAGH